MRGRIQPHSASERGTSRHQFWRVGVHVSAGRTRHIGHRSKFHLRLFFGRSHLAEGNGLSTSGAINLDVPFAGHGEIPWARAQSLYAGRDSSATAPCAVPNRTERYRGRYAGPQYPQLALEISWKLNRTTCRLTPVVQGEINGSKLWSSATHKRWLSRIPLAATDLGILHGRHHRRGHSFAPLVISSPLA